MNLYIPEIGDRLKLSKDWTFNLYVEYRNKKLLEKFGHAMNYGVRNSTHSVTLEKGVVLKVDRVYIRQGLQEFSSISFYAEFPGEPTKTGSFGKPTSARFWAKLSDCNNIEFEIEELKDITKPPLQWWSLSVFTKTDHRTTFDDDKPYPNSCDITAIIPAGVQRSSQKNTYRVQVTYSETWELISKETITPTSIFGRKYTKYYWKIKRPDLLYTLKNMDDTVIGTFNNATSLKKGANEHYKNI